MAIIKHIVAQEALAGGGKDVGVEESAGIGVIVAGLEVVESSILTRTTAAERKAMYGTISDAILSLRV